MRIAFAVLRSVTAGDDAAVCNSSGSETSAKVEYGGENTSHGTHRERWNALTTKPAVAERQCARPRTSIAHKIKVRQKWVCWKSK